MHAISAIPTQQMSASASTSLKSNEQQRNKKAFNVSQSPITYVQRLESAVPEAKISRSKQRTKAKKIVNSGKSKNVKSNHELLNSLGLGKLPSPSNHHRKRLATQSRHAGRPDDSKIFIVKLPPNPYYYSHVNGKISATANEPNAIAEEKSKKVKFHIILHHIHATLKSSLHFSSLLYTRLAFDFKMSY